MYSLVPASISSAADEIPVAQITEALAELAPHIEVTEVTESGLPGIYEVTSHGTIYYLSPDVRYLFEGSIHDLHTQQNISEARRGKLQTSLLNEVAENEMLVFNNHANSADRWITVFTDTDCGYCQKLHEEVPQLTSAGIQVRYLMYPRAGLESDSFRELQSVWCADDQQSAMTVAKSGGSVAHASCDNPIEEHMDLAHKVGLRGTPLIYLDNGTRVSGYRPANELIGMIENSEPMMVETR